MLLSYLVVQLIKTSQDLLKKLTESNLRHFQACKYDRKDLKSKHEANKYQVLLWRIKELFDSDNFKSQNYSFTDIQNLDFLYC